MVINEIWFIDNLEKREMEISRRSGIKVGDRWIGDVLRYTDAMHELGMISLSQRDAILRRYYSRNWTLPDLEIIFTANEETLKKRILSRNRKGEQKLQEIEFAKFVKKKFENYARGHSFNREIVIIDTSEQTEEETYKKR